MSWWIVWISKRGKQFHCVPAQTQFGAEMTMMTLTKKDMIINNVNVNYADTAWALQAPDKKTATRMCIEDWESRQLQEVANATD